MDNDILKVIMFVWIYGHKLDTDKLIKLSELDAVKFRIAIKNHLIEPYTNIEKVTYYQLTRIGNNLIECCNQATWLACS